MYAAQGITDSDTLCPGRTTAMVAMSPPPSPLSPFVEGIIVDTVETTYDGSILFERSHISGSQSLQTLADNALANTNLLGEDIHKLSTALVRLAFSENGAHLLLFMMEEIHRHLEMPLSFSIKQILEALLPLDEESDAAEVVERIKSATVDDPDILDFAIHIYRQVCRLCMNATIFRSKAGRIGVGPTTTTKGNSVVVLWGGSTPFILRPDAEAYLYVGVAHVRSTMQGEAIRAWEETGEAATMFELR